LRPAVNAIAVPNQKRSNALPSAAHRNPTPAMSATASDVSAIVAAQARNGIVPVGMNGFNSAVRLMKRAKLSQLRWPVHRPKRPATADRNAAATASRA
jgi:hypothetical protein